jgi:predicted acylesterase/phospholipase RssA
MDPRSAITESSPIPEEGHIGLALSGGGFRASLFHLGVIRRLEELGIMEKISVVSAVSGGSIIAAFYLSEMEKQLREDRLMGRPSNRVDLFEKIAARFLLAVDHNLRTRALIFTPWYHPILFFKTTFLKAVRPGARAELIQAEYDKFFFFGDTMDQLPVERGERTREKPGQSCTEKDEPFYGPRLLLNTTSLLTGERRAFSRDTSSGIKDLKTSDRNVLPLSRVVGASSGVPVVFPPTAILGDLLVDGGVADNQGIDGLLEPEPENEESPNREAANKEAANKESQNKKSDNKKPEDRESETQCNVILVSDASGQMQVKHSLSRSEIAVYARVNEVYQFQIRNNLLERLLSWGKDLTIPRRFAFIHLLVNLKNREGLPPRVSTNILPALGRIRTDLDQFSPVECEALMYHGYTLIDAQLRQYCCDYFSEYFPRFRDKPKLRTPPLFEKSVQMEILEKAQKKGTGFRDPVRKDLEAGSTSLYLLRCLKKHPWPTLPALLLGFAVAFWLIFCCFGPWQWIVSLLERGVYAILFGIVPQPLVTGIDAILKFFGYAAKLQAQIGRIAHLLAMLAVIALAFYLVSFPVYFFVRWTAMKLDRWNYWKITGKHFSVHWEEDKETVRTITEEVPATPPEGTGLA